MCFDWTRTPIRMLACLFYVWPHGKDQVIHMLTKCHDSSSTHAKCVGKSVHVGKQHEWWTWIMNGCTEFLVSKRGNTRKGALPTTTTTTTGITARGKQRTHHVITSCYLAMTIQRCRCWQCNWARMLHATAPSTKTSSARVTRNLVSWVIQKSLTKRLIENLTQVSRAPHFPWFLCEGNPRCWPRTTMNN